MTEDGSSTYIYIYVVNTTIQPILELKLLKGGIIWTSIFQFHSFRFRIVTKI